jgi:DNA-binding response OmpR family regulator
MSEIPSPPAGDPHTVLLIEDEMRIARWTQTYIENAGYTCLWASNGTDGLHMALRESPDLVILDIMLPGMDGWEVCKRIRERSDVPIIMLTARITDTDTVRGLDIGADDYMTKPFNPLELIARIRANIRRAEGKITPDQTLTAGPIRLDLVGNRCWVGGQPVRLTAQQFDLLAYFMQHPGQVLTRRQLIDNAFGPDYVGYERAVDIHISRLRTRLAAASPGDALIETVFGVGYRLVAGQPGADDA